VDRQELRLGDGTVVAWVPADHCLPVSDELVAYFDSPAYLSAAAAARDALLERGLHAAH
jgi:hypothetical protein